MSFSVNYLVFCVPALHINNYRNRDIVPSTLIAEFIILCVKHHMTGKVPKSKNFYKVSLCSNTTVSIWLSLSKLIFSLTISFILRYAVNIFNAFQIFLFNRWQILCLVFPILFCCLLDCLRMADCTGTLQHFFPRSLQNIIKMLHKMCIRDRYNTGYF